MLDVEIAMAGDDIFVRAELTLRAHEQTEGEDRYSDEELAAEREALGRLVEFRDHMAALGAR